MVVVGRARPCFTIHRTRHDDKSPWALGLALVVPGSYMSGWLSRRPGSVGLWAVVVTVSACEQLETAPDLVLDQPARAVVTLFDITHDSPQRVIRSLQADIRGARVRHDSAFNANVATLRHHILYRLAEEPLALLGP